jgi:hypothetical protein
MKADIWKIGLSWQGVQLNGTTGGTDLMGDLIYTGTQYQFLFNTDGIDVLGGLCVGCHTYVYDDGSTIKYSVNGEWTGAMDENCRPFAPGQNAIENVGPAYLDYLVRLMDIMGIPNGMGGVVQKSK